MCRFLLVFGQAELMGFTPVDSFFFETREADSAELFFPPLSLGTNLLKRCSHYGSKNAL